MDEIVDLVDFLLKKMDDKNLSPADITRRSGLSASQVSKVLNRESPAGQKALECFAQALDLPIEVLYQYAGRLGKPTKANEDEQELIHIYKKMSGNNKEDLIDYARMKMKQQEREKNDKRDRVN